jgi:hypothetical protein
MLFFAKSTKFTYTSSMNMSKAALKPCQTMSLGPVSRTDRSLKQKVRAALWGISIPYNHQIRIQNSLKLKLELKSSGAKPPGNMQFTMRLPGSAGALIFPPPQARLWYGVRLAFGYQYCLRCRSCMPCGVHAVLKALLLLHEPLGPVPVPGGRALRMSRAGIQQHSRLL